MVFGFLEDLWEGLTKPLPNNVPKGYKPSYSTKVTNTNKAAGPGYKPGSRTTPKLKPAADKKPAKPYNGPLARPNGANALNGAIKSATQPRKSAPMQPNIRQAMEADNPMVGTILEPEAPMEDPYADLLSGLEDFGGGGSFDFTEQTEQARRSIMESLDGMLNGQLGALNKARGEAQGNFNTSDANLAAMHSAFQNDIATNGRAAYQSIGDQLTSSLNANRDASVGALQKFEAEDLAEQSAMLKNLGIEAAAPGLTSTVYDDASADITKRIGTDVSSAAQQTANNQTFNQGLATTTGLQGMNRRAALQQQLQGILGQLGEKEADVQAGYQQAKTRAEMDLQQMGQQGAQQNAEQAWRQYTYEQDRIMDRANRMEDMDFQREMSGYEQEMAAQQAAAKAQSTPVSGFAGLTQDLANNYGPQMAQRVTQALSEVYNSTELEQRADSDVRRDPTALAVNALVRKGIPNSVALHAVTNYNQLGNTSKFTPR